MDTPASPSAPIPPLQGVRVLDVSTRVAGPYCSCVLAEFGADVVKIEQPGQGDPYRSVGTMTAEGSSLNFLNDNRNKRSMTLDLHTEAGAEIFKRMAADADMVVENFRPGTLEKWGLGYDVLEAANPGLILVRVSAYGQSGPYSGRAGVARLAYGFAGISYLCGQADGPPLYPGTNALGDYIAGQCAATGALLAYIARGRHGRGQVVDVSLYESLLRMLDELVPAYAMTGYVRERSGASSPHTVPSNHYRTRDGNWITLSASSSQMFRRLAEEMGHPELADRFPTSAARVRNRDEVERYVCAWVAGMTRDQAIEAGLRCGVPIGPINSVRDLFEDPHVRRRGTLRTVAGDAGTPVTLVDTTPRLSRDAGGIRALGPRMGEHTESILRQLGMSNDDIAALRTARVI